MLLAAAATAKVASTLAVTATASASACPANARTRPGPCSSAVVIVPRLQSPPAITAPRTMNGAVPPKLNWKTAMMLNWLGSSGGSACAGVPYAPYSAGVRLRYPMNCAT
jgi:hypothetical protein